MPEPGFALRLRRARRRLLFLGVRTLVRTIGFARARAVGELIGEIGFRLGGNDRRRMQRDMAVALGRPVDDPAVGELLREAYRVNDGAVLQMMAMFDRRQDEARLATLCEIDGLEHLRSALSQGRGTILLAAHMGNSPLLPIVLVHAGWRVSVVYKEARMGSAEFYRRGLEQYGIQAILANAGIRAYGQMLGALKQGRIVFMMLDQGVKKAGDGMVRNFLGKDMPMPAGPAQLARASRAPVLPVATTAARPAWRFSIQPALPLDHVSLEEDVDRIVGATQMQVLGHPQFWSWHHRRWRKFPVAAPRSA